MNVNCCQSQHHQEGRKDEHCSSQGCTKRSRAQPAEIHRQLRRERTRRKLRKRESFSVTLPQTPLTLLHQIPLHVAGKRNGPAETQRSELEEVGQKFPQRGVS